jgi:hypothetical protein
VHCRHAHGESLSRTNAITATRQATPAPSSARGRWGLRVGTQLLLLSSPEPEQELPSPQHPLTRATVAVPVHACAGRTSSTRGRGRLAGGHSPQGLKINRGRPRCTVPRSELQQLALTRGAPPFAARRRPCHEVHDDRPRRCGVPWRE